MKKYLKFIAIIIPLLVSQKTFAADIFCPSYVNCTSRDDPSTCTFAGGSPPYFTLTPSEPEFEAAFYPLSEVIINGPPNTAICYYIQKGLGVVMLRSTFPVSPDIEVAGNLWTKTVEGNNCLNPQSTNNCPMILEIKK